MTKLRHVYLVDDDEAVRTALGRHVTTLGYSVRSFPSGPAFLAEVTRLAPGCLLLDLRMPGMSGLEVQQELASRGLALPVVFLTAHGDLTTGITAMKGGASDFLQKPVREAILLQVLDHAWARLEGHLQRRAAARQARERLAVLSPREQEVLALVASGHRSRAIAARLSISYQTAKVHRMRAMAKLGLKTLPELSRLLAEADGE